MTSGIYCIENKINGRKYIGKDSKIPSRWKYHLRKLRKNIHENRFLQNSWKEHGEENFSYIILEEVEKDNLGFSERYYIQKFNTLTPNGYNMTKGGEYGTSGLIHTEKTKEKMSKSAKARLISPENRSMLGKHHSDKTKKVMSEKRIGTKMSDETKQRLSDSHIGKKFKNAKSKYIGVCKDGNLWRAWITINRKVVYIVRRCKKELEAAIAYDNYIKSNNLNRKTNF